MLQKTRFSFAAKPHPLWGLANMPYELWYYSPILNFIFFFFFCFFSYFFSIGKEKEKKT